MKTGLAIFILVLTTACASVRDAGRPFSEENVTRIMKTLSSDAMRGRSALMPDIALATDFIEAEFTSIGLQPMKVLKAFARSSERTE